MAKRWSGFIAQNMTAKEEWALLEASEAKSLRSAFSSVVEADEGWTEPVRSLESLVELLQKVGTQK